MKDTETAKLPGIVKLVSVQTGLSVSIDQSNPSFSIVQSNPSVSIVQSNPSISIVQSNPSVLFQPHGAGSRPGSDLAVPQILFSLPGEHLERICKQHQVWTKKEEKKTEKKLSPVPFITSEKHTLSVCHR